jgi:hypothetical protein
MPRPELRMSFVDRAALEQELASNLKHGRAFVCGGPQAIEVLSDCMLLLVRPDDGAELELLGQAVFVSEAGVGVQLRPFDAEIVAKLDAFARGERVSGIRERIAEQPADQAAQAGDETASSDSGTHAVDAPASAEPLAEEEAAPDEDLQSEQLPADASAEPAADAEESAPSDVQAQLPAHERMRRLSVTQQQKIARGGELNDRIALERLYGKAVWDGLLHNPKLTIPEVARIAQKGTAPRPLLELIVDNNTWIQAPQVRRALLGNPRVSGESILKLLRITPKHELKTIYKATAYSAQVREAARKVLEM